MTIKIDILLNKAQYKPGENIHLTLQLNHHPEKIDLHYKWTVFDLHRPVQTEVGVLESSIYGVTSKSFCIPAIENGSGAYGFLMVISDQNGNTYEVETAFDIAEHWREAPRYGFLSDFVPGDQDDSDIDYLHQHHINIVQYYDWMYRHDQLVPEVEDEFTEPLGRRISLSVVSRKIEKLLQKGINSMAYAAVYASLVDYAEQHPEQLLYNNCGEPYKLGDYYYIMDISKDSLWTRHILSEFKKVIEFGFSGLHLDQYGFPKKAIQKLQGEEQVVSLKDMYPAFINSAREAMPEAGLIFNNVSNYPIHTTAKTYQDVIYIEVWDPVSRLVDLKHMIDRAREISGKQVVLAAYLPSFQSDSGIERSKAEIGAAVTMAAIFASGGYHLLLGEHENILADSYYPNYGKISASFKSTLKHYYDFIVMYRHLLFDHALEDISMTFAGGINTEVTFKKEGVLISPVSQLNSIWNIVKEKSGFMIIHLINLCGLDNDIWHEPKQNPPTTHENVEIRVEMLEHVRGVYLASPDGDSILAKSLEFDWVEKDQDQGYCLRFFVPEIQYWTMVYIHTEEGLPRQL